MATKKKILLAVILALAALAAAVALVVCLSRGGPEAPDDPYAKPYGRMEDPAYLKQIDDIRAEQKAIAKRLSSIRAEMAALGDDTNSARYAELKADFEAARRDVEQNRFKAQAMVRDRILREEKAIEAKEKNLKEKGK